MKALVDSNIAHRRTQRVPRLPHQCRGGSLYATLERYMSSSARGFSAQFWALVSATFLGFLGPGTEHQPRRRGVSGDGDDRPRGIGAAVASVHNRQRISWDCGVI